MSQNAESKKINEIEDHLDAWQKRFGNAAQDCKVCSQIPKTQEDSSSGESEAPGEELSAFIKRLYHVVNDIRTSKQSGDVDILGCGGCGQLYKRFSESHDLAGFHSSSVVISKCDLEEALKELITLEKEGDEYKLVPFVSSRHMAAEDGDVSAQFTLGLYFAEGTGEKQNYEEALKWFRLAAEQGHSQSLCNIATFYFQAWGVEKNYETSVDYFRKAAELGLSQAQYMLGYMYDEGLGIELNKEEAILWFKKAAEQGNEMAIKTMSMKMHPYRCPECSSTNVKDNGVYEFHMFSCKDCGYGETVSIIYPESDWNNYG